MTWINKVIVGVAMAGLMAACSDSGDAERDIPGSTSADGSAELARPDTQLTVPTEYDTSRGWELGPEMIGQVQVLPHSEAIASIKGTDREGFRITVIDVATGQTRWSSRTLHAIPGGTDLQVLSPSVDGVDYLVAWSSGTIDDDLISKGKSTVSIDIFVADASGEAVEPARSVEVEAQGKATDGGGGLLVSGHRDGIVTVDLASGTTKTHDPDTVKQPANCNGCRHGAELVAVTAKGPLFRGKRNYSTFWMPGAWSSHDITPQEADPDLGEIWQAKENLLIAKWGGKNIGARNVWAVLDGATGEVRAKVLCPRPQLPSIDTSPRPFLSPNGRYLVSGHTVFDLEKHQGHCFEETDDSKPLTFFSVTDQGYAFGSSHTKNSYLGTYTPVQIDIATGKPKDLPEMVLLPIVDIGGFGIFREPKGAHPLVAYAHAS